MRRKKVILIRDSMGNEENQMMKKVALFVRKILTLPGNQVGGEAGMFPSEKEILLDFSCVKDMLLFIKDEVDRCLSKLEGWK